VNAASGDLDRIIRRAELLGIVGVSAATLYRWIGEGHFPSPIKLGPNSVGWRSSEVKAWIDSLEAATVGCAASDQSPRKDGR
jgi:prophage regulatory protein